MSAATDRQAIPVVRERPGIDYVLPCGGLVRIHGQDHGERTWSEIMWRASADEPVLTLQRSTTQIDLCTCRDCLAANPERSQARSPLTGVRLQRLRDVAQLLANEVGEVGDAILIVREVARACGGKVNESLVSLLAKTAGVVAAECGSARGRVAVLSGEAYDETKHLLGNATEVRS